MKTITKKDLVDRIADQTGNKRVVVKRVIQSFLDEIIKELGEGNRLEFRDFGVFELRARAARIAQNPKTMEKVHVPGKRTVKFKVGRLMKDRLFGENGRNPATITAVATNAQTGGYRACREWLIPLVRLLLLPPGLFRNRSNGLAALTTADASWDP